MNFKAVVVNWENRRAISDKYSRKSVLRNIVAFECDSILKKGIELSLTKKSPSRL